MEASGAAVQVVGAVVDGEVVFLAVQREVAFTNAVAVTAYEGGEEGLGRIDAVVDVVVSLNDVSHLTFAVGHHDGYLHAVGIGKEEEVRLLTIDNLLEVFLFQSTEG